MATQVILWYNPYMNTHEKIALGMFGILFVLYLSTVWMMVKLYVAVNNTDEKTAELVKEAIQDAKFEIID